MSSLQEQIAARRTQRAKERTFVLPVRGYEDLGLSARYRVLSYEELRNIDTRNQDEAGPDGELARYADTLIQANTDLLHNNESLGCRWESGASTLRENLGLNVPDGASARDCLFEVFNGNGGGNDLFLHWTLWDQEASKTASGLDEEMAGESVPSQEGILRLEPTQSLEEYPHPLGNSIPVPTPTTGLS